MRPDMLRHGQNMLVFLNSSHKAALGIRAMGRSIQGEAYISGSFCVSMTAAIGMPKLETGPQKSAETETLARAVGGRLGGVTGACERTR